jgi:hypothetical protein
VSGPLVLALAFAATISAPQAKCDFAAKAAWQSPEWKKAESYVPLSAVFWVRPERRGSAIAMLVDRSIVPLDEQQAAALSEAVAETPGRSTPTPPLADLSTGRKPFLVRAVFPGIKPYVQIGWTGQTLIVAGRNLGCHAFTNEALVVWLEKQPADVVVWASEAQ